MSTLPESYPHTRWHPCALTLVTGPRGAGKTTWCLAQAARARACGARVAGLASPAVMEGTFKVGIDVMSLGSGERRRLAGRHLAAACTAAPGGALDTKHWRLDASAVAWGEAVLGQIAAEGCDWLVIDELGVLEFERGAGWRTGLRLVDRGACRRALVVVRPALLRAARRRWPWARVKYLLPAAGAAAPSENEAA